MNVAEARGGEGVNPPPVLLDGDELSQGWRGAKIDTLVSPSRIDFASVRLFIRTPVGPLESRGKRLRLREDVLLHRGTLKSATPERFARRLVSPHVTCRTSSGLWKGEIFAQYIRARMSEAGFMFQPIGCIFILDFRYFGPVYDKLVRQAFSECWFQRRGREWCESASWSFSPLFLWRPCIEFLSWVVAEL